MAKSKTKKTHVQPLDDEEELQVKSGGGKSKTKKSKVQPLDDDEEPQVKGEDEATEIAEDAEDVDDGEVTEIADDAEDAAVALEDEATELDDEPQVKDARENDEDVAEDDAEPVAADTELEDGEKQVKAKAGEGDGGDDQEDSSDEGPTSPPAKISRLSVALILLNWIAAPAFIWVAYLDHKTHTDFSYRTYVNYVQTYGLPLRCEEPGAPGYDPMSSVTRRYIHLSSKQLADAFRARRGTKGSVVKEGSFEFAPFEERIILDKDTVSVVKVPFRLRPSDLTENYKVLGVLPVKNNLLKDIFQDVANPVPTLEDEIVRLQTDLPTEIAKAAGEAKDALKAKKDADKRVLVAKAFLPYSWDPAENKRMKDRIEQAGGKELDDLAKRAVIRNVRLSFAWDVWQVKKLSDQADKATAADLDKMLDDSLQLRMYYDLLAPLNVFRSGNLDPKTYKIEQLSAHTVEEVKGFLDERLKAAVADTYNTDVHIGSYWEKNAGANGMKRDSVERRRMIGFILFAVSQVSAPTLDRPLYPKGIERAQIISGLYEFTDASIYYVRTLRVLQERIVNSIVADRDGVVVALKAGGLTRTAGFPAQYEEEINRLVIIVYQIDDAEKRLKALRGQRDQYQKTHDERARQHQAALDKLLKARKQTEKYLQELEGFQDRLYRALTELSDAGERNERVYRQIVELTRRYPPEEGGPMSKQKGKKRP